MCVMLDAGDRDHGGGAMSIQIRGMLGSGVGQLRYEPTAKRIRAVLGGGTVVDTTRAVLVWEPRRVVPSYAVPVEDFRGDLIPAGSAEAGAADGIGVRVPDLSARPVLDPSVPFAAHSTEGDVVDVRAVARPGPGRGSARPTRSWPAMWCSTSVRSMPGMRRTSA